MGELVFDWRNPDYPSVFQQRANRLRWMREDLTGSRAETLKRYYADHIADFINDWGVTFDPRNADRDLPTLIPFLLFDAQREWVDWFIERWRAREDGLTDKSRDMGVSWLCVGAGTSLAALRPGLVIGFGSRTEDDVDKAGDPDCLFWKGREFVSHLPSEFRGGFQRSTTSSHLLLRFPETGSVVKGDAGKNIGRGGRAAIYITDEDAHLENPAAVDAALSQTTNCRIRVSTPCGMANSFAQARFGGKISVRTLHWRDDPRKDEAWYKIQVDRLDPVTLAQEVDLDYSASIIGVLIPSIWVQAAIGAHVKLGLSVSGSRFGAMDVADEGIDKNAFAGGQGFLLDFMEEWSGKGGDIYQSVQRSFLICDQEDYEGFLYDADGLGAGVRGDSRQINEARPREDHLWVDPFQGSGAVLHPDRKDYYKRKNKDFFANRKAQAWWSLRARFQNTYRWVVEDRPCDPDDIISISPKLKQLTKLTSELSQPTYTINSVGKIVVDKKPDDMPSPNLADAVMIRYSGARRAPMRISQAALQRAAQR